MKLVTSVAWIGAVAGFLTHPLCEAFQTPSMKTSPSSVSILKGQWSLKSVVEDAVEDASSSSSSSSTSNNEKEKVVYSRKGFMNQLVRASGATCAGLWAVSSSSVEEAGATVYLDPAMYGDQELRVSAVDSLRESVRRAVLQDPTLTVAFYRLALMDGLSYDSSTGKGGPDGTVLRSVLSSKDTSDEVLLLKKACEVILESCKRLKKLSSITVADAIALAGAQSVESVGGPVLSVQLGRTDAPPNAPLSPLPLNLLSSSSSPQAVSKAFRTAGMTEREMVALLGLLLTLDLVEKNTPSGTSWKKSAKPQFRERGKMGRMSEFKKLSDEDIQKALDSEFDEDEDDEDDEEYIADTFGTRDQAFGKRVNAADEKKNFNRFLKDLMKQSPAQVNSPEFQDTYGWIGSLILDKSNPTPYTWLQKYATGDLIWRKDLGVAYNAVTQLGAEYTGGKYENLLKNKPRKSLNDD